MKHVRLSFIPEPKKHGGSRPGAGRPPKETPSVPTTKAVRLPADLADKKEDLIALVALVADWRSRSESGSPTSVRWEHLREFLADAEKLGF